MKLCDLTVSNSIPAPAEAVYDVWLDPKSPGSPWFGSKRVIMNAVVDGLYYHSFEWEGKLWAHYGRFVRLERPRIIEHTWVSEATQGFESVMTLTLQPRDGRTDVTLVHSGVPDDKLGRQHEQGWTSILDSIVKRFASSSRTIRTRWAAPDSPN